MIRKKYSFKAIPGYLGYVTLRYVPHNIKCNYMYNMLFDIFTALIYILFYVYFKDEAIFDLQIKMLLFLLFNYIRVWYILCGPLNVVGCYDIWYQYVPNWQINVNTWRHSYACQLLNNEKYWKFYFWMTIQYNFLFRKNYQSSWRLPSWIEHSCHSTTRAVLKDLNYILYHRRYISIRKWYKQTVI